MDYAIASDQDLWQNCQQHDDLKAYDELFNRYLSKLHRVGLRYFSDHGLVEELISDVLFDLWQRRKTIFIEKSLSGYLFKAIHFQCLSHLRKKTPLLVAIQNVPEDKLVAQHTPDHYLRGQELAYAYEQALCLLTPQRRKVFELSREDGMSYAEIARELSISKNTVELHMSAALKTFRRFFKAFGIQLLALASFLFCG